MQKLYVFILTRGLFMGAGLLFASPGFTLVPEAKEGKALRQSPEPQDSLALIRRYRTWTKVNPVPVRMLPAAATQCVAASPAQQHSPHLGKFITVYVNRAGKETMTRKRNPHFPPGTVIVKEKLATPDSRAPELMTVMVKRGAGYNPVGGDWEYFVVDGAGKQITAQGNLESCQRCHSQPPAKNSDFVFRDFYLPQSHMSLLR